MSRGIFDTIAAEEYLELAAGVSLALATLYQAEKGLFEVPRAVDDPFPSRLNG